jgi:hypothetical protein
VQIRDLQRCAGAKVGGDLLAPKPINISQPQSGVLVIPNVRTTNRALAGEIENYRGQAAITLVSILRRPQVHFYACLF